MQGSQPALPLLGVYSLCLLRFRDRKCFEWNGFPENTVLWHSDWLAVRILAF